MKVRKIQWKLQILLETYANLIVELFLKMLISKLRVNQQHHPIQSKFRGKEQTVMEKKL